MTMTLNIRFFRLILLLLGSGVATAQVYWEPLIRRETLAGPLPYERVECFSSRGNGLTNEDRGNYIGPDAFGWNILCDFEGPGVLVEFGWARRNPGENLRFRIFVDDTTQWVLDKRADSLCGRTSPFLPPLADSTAGWSWNYAPIPFQSSLRITYTGNSIAYHGCATLYDSTASFVSFRAPVPLSYFLKRDTMATVWAEPTRPAMWNRPATSLAVDSTLPVFATRTLIDYDGAGVVRRLWLLPQETSRSYLSRTVARIYVDNNPEPAIAAQVGMLFGCSFGVASYASAITGLAGDTLYFNAPMPFSTEFRVEFQNNLASPATNRIRIGADIVTPGAENVPAYRLGGQVNVATPTNRYDRFRAAGFSGRGTYLGVFLELENTSGAVLEGDELLYADGNLFRAGLGTPEYFNGSYNWLAPNGVPAFARHFAHGVVTITNNDFACYRYHMSDAVPFEQSLELDFEVGAWGHLNGNYRSIAFAYLEPLPFAVRDQDSSGTSVGGELLSIFGRGLANGRTLSQVLWNDISLEYVSGATVAQDSSINIVVRAPFTQSGTAALVAQFTDGSLTIDPAWTHRADPEILFHVRRADENGFAFAGDTLDLELRGYPANESAAIVFMGEALPWIGATMPRANSNGVIRGQVKLQQNPAEMPEGSAPLIGQALSTEGFPDAVSTESLTALRLARIEIETMPVVQVFGGTSSEVCACDFQSSGSVAPWGRMLVRRMVADSAGEGIRLALPVDVSGNYRLSYFVGEGSTAGYLHVKIDQTPDLDSVQIYDPLVQPSGSFARSDTIRGNWIFLTPGIHSVTITTSRATPLQQSYELFLDQILFESEFHQGIPVNAQPRTELPTTVTLSYPYPNPFNATTRLKFSLSHSADVRLEVFNLLGQRVTTILDESLPAGEYVREFACPECASGLYLARLSLPGTMMTRKLLLLK